MVRRKTVFRSKYLYAFPQVDWDDATVMKKTEAYHPTSSRLWNWSVMGGMAVARMVMSMTARSMVRTSPRMIMARWTPCG